MSGIEAIGKTHAYFETEAITASDSFVAQDAPNYGGKKSDICIMVQGIGVCDLHSFRLKDDWQVDNKCNCACGMQL